MKLKSNYYFLIMKTIKFKIITPEKIVYENEIQQLTVPTIDGEITILPEHIPLISILKTGEMKLKDNNGEHSLSVAGGFIEVRGKNEVVVLADNAERVEEIDLERAEKARKRAEERVSELEKIDF